MNWYKGTNTIQKFDENLKCDTAKHCTNKRVAHGPSDSGLAFCITWDRVV
jgi:hypothetical protein